MTLSSVRRLGDLVVAHYRLRPRLTAYGYQWIILISRE